MRVEPKQASLRPKVYNPLGLIRIAAVIYLVFALGDRLDFFYYASKVDPILMTENYFFRFIGSTFPFDIQKEVLLGKTAWGLYKAVFWVAAFCAGVGFFTRFSLLVFGAVSLYLNAGIAANLQYNHESVLSQHLLFVLAISPGVKSISVDALLRGLLSMREFGVQAFLRHLKGRIRSEQFWRLKTREPWGTKLVLAVFFVVYLASGVSKLVISEGKWWDGQTLGYYLGRTQVEDYWIADLTDAGPSEEGKPFIRFVDHTYGFQTTEIGQWIASFPELLVLLSIGTLIWELSPFLLFFPPLYRNAYLLWSVSMHVGIGLAMKLGFPSYQVYLLLLVDWPAFIRGCRRVREDLRMSSRFSADGNSFRRRLS
ncbi:hypothetical protein [Pelagicoccus sp. SDUM812002]|uniref:hypothetical protein n=1 Tax=Pelagicoccus sp. SDUM812002 TaxID=3041266 RepID=UPI00280D27FF|nr:hypothetical protein [Pelagicoccus sp. SDUM812002]MDQ8184001.1 hypothetical protein [Pelagicoccus sp. SDUM812002]